ncbi:IclR family transcriptional regulator [Colwellia sp. 4_MG-2023]|uniref:IclR family transcriptional regulator n=1 Tax=unclassified Colwellia TaxID=196834 RepID=UPI001C084B25|nr:MULTISPECIES: IclR family transcriptional regulator [unclassified Colwellia]MBU2924726.1 IclR family transcriptional regulator [Colwellia sp. C2M11]MDO6507075.1 IclR family transcriptional regulator [Colwellia sp. 5_MG-2023]MDO6555879.1 IclR family transcriptional regulator [Colwellia sp. 4_MG-2023]MDO6653562.1 IclR family transcriptional regulator [Colwellia sp. 3_MG-2023]MDO6666337.1 IclR family transcriptional regulator [Colwellia sp. 2_MG-2023]
MTEKNTTKETGSRKKHYSAPALEKGLDLLELLSYEVDGLNIAEITRRLDKSVGELFRMLAVLEQRGFIEMPMGSDRYRLTLKMFSLSNRFPPIKRLTSLANPLMQSLSYTIEQSCHLVIYYEGKGHVIVQQDSPSTRIFSVRLGAEAPLMNTCSGHLLLAFSSPERRELMLKRIPKSHPKPNKKALNNIVTKIAEQGFEKIISAQAQGVEDIGYPVFDDTGQIAAALVVPFIGFLDGSRLVSSDSAHEKIKATAEDMSRLLGY